MGCGWQEKEAALGASSLLTLMRLLNPESWSLHPSAPPRVPLLSANLPKRPAEPQQMQPVLSRLLLWRPWCLKVQAGSGVVVWRN